VRRYLRAKVHRCIRTYNREKLARINVTISDELADRFRVEVGKRLGAKQGSISIAAGEAFEDWIKKVERR